MPTAPNLITISQAVELIRDNQVVALPTETVYGLFGLANSQIAVSRVFSIKNRPADNPLICHFRSIDQIRKYVSNIPEVIEFLLSRFAPGPLTVILNIPKNSPLSPALAGLSTVCCRIPNNELTLEILRTVNIPLFGPSANTSTRVSATSPDMVHDDLGDRISGIVDGGTTNIGLESTIIDYREGQIRILRPGAIGVVELENALEEFNDINIQRIIVKDNNSEVKTVVPGNKYRHYSPTVEVHRYQNQDINKKTAVAGFDEDIQKFLNSNKDSGDTTIKSLGSIHNLTEVSHNLYSNLASLDNLGVNQVYFLGYDLGQSSLAIAISNRLNKVILK